MIYIGQTCDQVQKIWQECELSDSTVWYLGNNQC